MESLSSSSNSPSKIVKSHASSSAGKRVLPGFALTLGTTLLYVGVMILLPFSALAWRAAGQPLETFWNTATSERVLAALKLTLLTSLAGASINLVFGIIVAWMLVRYEFPGRRIVDAFVDLPFALPAAVGGMTLTTIYSQNGLLGKWTYSAGFATAFTPIGITIAVIFVGLPFVIRSVQPALENLEGSLEEAASTLGASEWQTFARVIFPPLIPAALSGFSLALARGLGEFGAVIFISGNIPYKTEYASFLIAVKLDEYDYAGATALATVMLLGSFLLLLAVNLFQHALRVPDEKDSH